MGPGDTRENPWKLIGRGSANQRAPAWEPSTKGISALQTLADTFVHHLYQFVENLCSVLVLVSRFGLEKGKS